MCVCFWIYALHICWEMFWELNMLIGFLFEKLACCIHLFMFFLLEKLLFFKLDRSSTISLSIEPSFSFLDRSQQILDPSRFLGFSSIDSRQLLRSIELNFWAFCLPDSFLTDTRSIKVIFLLSIDPRQYLNRFISIKI